MLNSEVIHGQNRRNSAGAKTNQPINHGNVLKKVTNASVKTVGSSMVPRLELIRKSSISSEPSNSH